MLTSFTYSNGVHLKLVKGAVDLVVREQESELYAYSASRIRLVEGQGA